VSQPEIIVVGGGIIGLVLGERPAIDPAPYHAMRAVG
jgi:hypothetical protein